MLFWLTVSALSLIHSQPIQLTRGQYVRIRKETIPKASTKTKVSDSLEYAYLHGAYERDPSL